ncbi:hypothetical protein ACQUWN_22295 [Rossellomorea aquimaris]|uniref:hypothetical protein n=1 Tax=Rossellomorea TaxID=2837508 RepID=UPI0021CCE43D|nr:hypothetical protein [Rossellomorea vietnamensis]
MVRNLGLTCHQKWKHLVQPRQATVLKRKKGVLPFILLRLFDPEGLGAGTRRPLLPQEFAPFSSNPSRLKGEEGRKVLKNNNLLEKSLIKRVFFTFPPPILMEISGEEAQRRSLSKTSDLL